MLPTKKAQSSQFGITWTPRERALLQTITLSWGNKEKALLQGMLDDLNDDEKAALQRFSISIPTLSIPTFSRRPLPILRRENGKYAKPQQNVAMIQTGIIFQ